METSASLSAGFSRTPVRGWAVALLSRLHMSSVTLVSFSFGVFLPYMAQDLDLSPLEAGVLQGVWWVTVALMALPFSVWFSRFRPVPLVLVSLLLASPFLFLQGLAWHFGALLLARFCFVLFSIAGTPARPLLLQQWVAPRQYALVNAVGLSQHSIVLALAISSSGLLITWVGSWRWAYMILGGFFLLQVAVWLAVARESKAPVQGLQRALQAPQDNPLKALRAYPQGWLVGLTLMAMAATWTALVTFLPTLLWETRGLPPSVTAPLLGCLYYALIPGALFGGMLEKRVTQRRHLLWVPALVNLLFGVAATSVSSPWWLAAALTAIGLAWVASPVMEILPFEFPGIGPRQVAVIVSLLRTLSGIGFAVGPLLTGLMAELTGSLQTGLLVMCLLTSVGVVAGWLYPPTVAEAPLLADERP